MAVNYGLGGFQSEFAFGAVAILASQTITITTQNVYVDMVGAKFQPSVLGNNTAGIFSNAYHQVDFVDSGMLEVKTSGVYLITYNITTSDPSNKTLSIRIVKRKTSGVIVELGGIQKIYCRSGDQFETGSNCLAFLESGDSIYTQVSNTDGTQNITITSLNVSIVKLNYSGSINS
tara:strand:- start:921 stop:1445 length:525 start_codon:yes stop_codon:yes gene_type:complete